MTYFRRLCASAAWMAMLQAKMPSKADIHCNMAGKNAQTVKNLAVLQAKMPSKAEIRCNMVNYSLNLEFRLTLLMSV